MGEVARYPVKCNKLYLYLYLYFHLFLYGINEVIVQKMLESHQESIYCVILMYVVKLLPFLVDLGGQGVYQGIGGLLIFLFKDK